MSARRSYACLFLITVLLVTYSYADWRSDANDRIESIRKRNAQITVVDVNGTAVVDVNVKIEQTKHRFGFGSAIDYTYINNSSYTNFFKNHFEWAVCGNESKWWYNEQTQGSVLYTAADSIYTWCNTNGIKMRGHNIFWEESGSLPSWVPGLAYAPWPQTSALYSACQSRLSSCVPHFQNKFLHWDVDNEILASDSTAQFFDRLEVGGPGSTDVNSRVWMYVRAHQLDPNCILFTNEYTGNSWVPYAYDSSSYVTLLNTLLGKGAPIGGIGLQAHLGNTSTFDPASYYTNTLEPLASQGLPMWMTEFDVNQSDDSTRAGIMDDFYRICFSHSSVEGIMMWGWRKGDVWQTDWYLTDTNYTINQTGQRYETLLNGWTTKDANISNASGLVNFRGFHGTYNLTLTKPGEPNTEIHTITLDPGTGTESFVLYTGFKPDTNAPTPNPMTWASAPTATGPYTITMTATTATDKSTPVQYYFECTNHGEANSTWQTSPTYVASGLSASTLYTFRVKARDSAPALNQTDWSTSLSATTQPPDTTPPTPNPMTWASLPAATGSTTISMTATTATDTNNMPVQYYFECTNHGEANSTWQLSPTYIASGLNPSTLYSFRVKARDSSPALNQTDWSDIQSAITRAPVSDVNILGSWLGGISTPLPHTKEPGDYRILLFIAHVEKTSTINLNSVTYGGQAMTKVMDKIVSLSGTYSYVVAFMLNEAGIVAATDNTFVPSWSITPDNVAYASAFLSNVNQTVPVGPNDSNSTAVGTQYTITTNPIATNEGDMVIVAASDGQPGGYTVNNGFTEDLDQEMSSSTGVVGHKSATGVPETPSVTISPSSNRQVIIGFVVQALVADMPPAVPSGLSATAGNKIVTLDWNDNTEADLAGYNIYRSTVSESNYSKLNVSLLSDSNYIDTNVTNGVTYYYVVTAVDANGNQSGFSDEVSAKPNYLNCSQVLDANLGLKSDLNGDCYVDYKDLDIIAGYWLSTDCGSSNNCGGADFAPTNGTVDFFDFEVFAEQWMQCNNPQDANCTANW